ncbi:MAG TPA: MGMT family protein, partial [Brevibacterium sp.]|nr:MGMT family protein [Brevibacterium sp.]
EALPSGRWTTYGELARFVGTAAQAVGNHLTVCTQCVNPHRVLTREGRVAEAFRWDDPADKRNPQEMLEAEGVTFSEGRADPLLSMTEEDLASLIPEVSETADGE